jgi:general nucleoside transport system permease protein
VGAEVEFLLTALRTATPLAFVALGVLLAERAGILLMGVEGAMLTGAFTAIAVTVATGSPWLGVAAGMAAGLAAGGVLGALTVWLPTDQIVMGLAFNIACAGITSFFFRISSAAMQRLTPVLAFPIPEAWAAAPGMRMFLAVAPLAWLAAAAAALVWYYLYHTSPGLLLRTCGHSAVAARAAGVNVRATRASALAIAGAFSGLGGAALTVGWVRSFSDEITLGRGFIALAAVYLARWHPGWALAACLVFGAGEALAFRAQVLGGNPHLYLMVPYVLTLAVVGIAGRARAPQEAGRPYP